jgi:hypothetical protein
LNLLDFYQQGHLNTLVYAVTVDKEEAIQACQNIRTYPAMSERMRLSFMRRVVAYVESLGGL